jgi:hypothetical protein
MPGDTRLVDRVESTGFFVDVVASGAVLGVGVGDSPEAVAAVLGDDFAEDAGRLRLRRDYGLVEFHWDRRATAEDWHATGFGVQVHRLMSREVAPAELVRRYGRFGERLRFEHLVGGLARIGYQLADITGDSDRPGWMRYWLEEARVCVTVTTVPWGKLQAGDVFAIHGPFPAEIVAAGSLGMQRQATKDGLRHLLRLDPAGRDEWLERRQPVSGQRVNWWLYLLLVAGSQIAGQPAQRRDWVQLSLWLLDAGHARDVFTDADYAERLAYFALDMRRRAAIEADLPSADHIVRVCLQAIVVSPEQAAIRQPGQDLASVDPHLLRASRQAKNLVTAAQWHLDLVADQQLAARLREWIAVKPRVV